MKVKEQESSNKIQELHSLIRDRGKQTRIWKRLELEIRKKKTEYDQILYNLRVKQLQLHHAKLVLTNQVQTVEGLAFQEPTRTFLGYQHLSFYKGLTKIRVEPEVLAEILSNLPTRLKSNDQLAQCIVRHESDLATFLIQGLYASPSTQKHLSK
eukprot:UN28629